MKLETTRRARYLLPLVGLTLMGGGLLLSSRTPESALRRKVALATRMLVRARMLDQSGHVSARIPGTNLALINPGNFSRNLITADDLVTFDIDAGGQSVWDGIRHRVVSQLGGAIQPGESEIHAAIYRARPDVMSVIHTHPFYSRVFSVTMKPILPVTVHGAIFSEGVPVFPHVGHVNSRELGDELAKTLGNRHAVLLKMHGAAFAGTSIEQAFVSAVYLEENAVEQLLAESSGTVHPMTAEEAERATRQGFDEQSIEKVWQYYADREALETGRP
jgi:ribulose-5-phosphate 4-epimerase/fuculose-1-phosphate aldolase